MANIRVSDQDKFQQFSRMAGPAIKNMVGRCLHAVQVLTGWKVMSMALL